MSALEERDTAIRELAKCLTELLRAETSTTETNRGNWKSFLAWLNTPFALALLSWLFGTGLTLGWNHFQQVHATELAEQRIKQEAKQRSFERRYDALYGLMMKFINEFPSALSRTYHAQHAYCTLMAYEKQFGAAASDPRDAELRAEFSKAEREAYITPVLTSFTPQISATFHTQQAREITAKLQAKIAALQKPVSVEATNAMVDEINKIYDEMVAAMNTELEQHTSSEAKLTSRPKA